MTFFLGLILTSLINISKAEQLPLFQTSPSSIKGPLIAQTFPDPSILYHDGITYAFATNNHQSEDPVHVQIATSYDNATWSIEDVDALPNIAPWQTGRAVWAPDVKHLADGRFLLYYTDSLIHSPRFHCIGAAIAEDVQGPYIPLSEPLICPKGGAIDPAGFLNRSTGSRYILYKVDGNSLGLGGSCNNDISPRRSTPIMIQEVGSDGTTLIGDPYKLLDRGKANGPLIEAPALYQSSEGIYFLFFSSNCFTSSLYDTSYATSTDLLGPYTKASQPLLVSGSVEGLVGPGGLDILHHSYADVIERNDDSEGRLVLFHGHITSENTERSHVEEQQSIETRTRPQQLIRGLYSAIARFDGHTVTLDITFDDMED